MKIMMDFKRQKSIIIKGMILFSIVIFISFATICPTLNLIQKRFDWFSLAVSFNYGFMNIFRTIYVAQFLFVCFTTRERFRKLNDYIMSSCTSFDTNRQIKPPAPSEFGRVFHILCDGISVINDTFTFQFIFLIPNIMVSYLNL